MPRITTGVHTAASIKLTAENLTQIAAQLQASAAAMEVLGIPEVTLAPEQGRADGVAWLQQWADNARNAVRDSQLAASRSVSPSTKPVSPTNHVPHKPKRK